MATRKTTKKATKTKAKAKAKRKARAKTRRLKGKTVNGEPVDDHTQFDDVARGKYLDQIRKHGNKNIAAKVVGITARRVRQVMEEDKEFKDLFEEALDEFVGYLEQTAVKFATEGFQDPVFDYVEELDKKGNPTGKFVKKQVGFTTTRRNPQVLQTLLKANAPTKYRENVSVDAVVKGGLLLVPPELSDDEWEELYGHPADSQATQDN